MKTSRDVAKIAKVSQATVSRVFTNPDLVSDKTKNKVLKAAEELNYSPNLAARSLKSNKSHMIGMIISSYDSIFYSAIAKRLERTLKDLNYRLLTTFSSEDPDTELECFNSLITSRVDGIIFTPVSLKTNHLLNISKRYNVSLLQLYRNANNEMNSLTINDEEGTYLATKELLKNKHQKILLIDYKTSVPTFRKNGYIRAFNEANINYSDDMIFYFNPDNDDYLTLKDIINKTKPTAIIAVTSNTGLHILKYFKEQKMHFPDDMSLIVYDDSTWTQINEISVISHPFDDITKEIANQIIKQINCPTKEPVHKKINPFFIKRNSVKPYY